MLTAAPPITVTGMELHFRRDLPGFKGARHFLVEPLGDGVGGDLRPPALHRHRVRPGHHAVAQPDPAGDLARHPVA